MALPGITSVTRITRIIVPATPNRSFVPAFVLAVVLILIPAVIPAPHGSAAAAAEPGYTIGVGDVLTVTIFAGGTTQQTLDLTVASSGSINFPFLGNVKAAGLSITELTEALTRPLAEDYFVDPQVIINIKEYKSQKVYITGAIEKPGVYALETSTTLIELIGKAGGVKKERGNVAYIFKGSMKELEDAGEIDQLVQKKKPVEVNLRELLDQGITSGNVVLGPDDVVYIQPSSFADSTQYKVFVFGKVEKPGDYDYQEGLTALDACIRAGGFAKYAAPNRTTITRRVNDKQETIDINLDKVRKGKAPDVPLMPGDRIHVPESWF